MGQREWKISELNQKWCDYVAYRYPFDVKARAKMFADRKMFYVYSEAFKMGYEEAEKMGMKHDA